MKFFQLKPVQILIAVLIPNVGSWIIFGILFQTIENIENDNGRIEPDWAPPGWVFIIANCVMIGKYNQTI